VVLAVQLVLAGLVDHDRLVGAANLVAQRAGHVELAAHCQAETQRVENGAGSPVVFTDPGHRGKPQTGGFADDLQDGRHSVDAADGGDIGVDGVGHGRSQCWRRSGEQSF